MTSALTYDSLVSDLQSYLDRDDAELQAQIPNFITLGEIRCSREVKNLGTKTSVVAAFQPGLAVYQKPARWLETCSINYGTGTAYTTLSRQAASGTRTLILSAAHSFTIGSSISVFNVGGTSYNGDFTVTAVTQFSVTYVTGAVTESVVVDGGGTVTAPLNIRTQLLPRSYEYSTTYWPDRTQVGTPRFYADYNYGNFLIVPTPQIGSPFEITFFQRPDPLSTTNQTNWYTQYARDLLLYACLIETASYLKDDQRIATWKDYYTQAANSIKMENKERVNDATIKRDE